VDDEPPDRTIEELLRREAFEEIGRMAFMAEDYAQKAFDAAERRDVMAVAVRLQQMRFCVMAMIQTFNHLLRERPHGQDLAGRGGPPDPDGEDQRAGDAVA